MHNINNLNVLLLLFVDVERAVHFNIPTFVWNIPFAISTKISVDFTVHLYQVRLGLVDW